MDSVSVIVTCYNHEQYIEECLESIFLQEYSNIQVYVYNDGSTDASETKINNMMALSPFPIKYVYHENMGVVKTRNRALDEVTGDFILFLDSDDKIEKNYICELVATAQQNKADIVYCGMKKLQTNDLFLEAPSFDLNRLLEGNYIHSASLIRQKVISNVRYDLILNHDKLEDYDFFLNLIINRQAKAVANLNTYLLYRISENSRSHHKDWVSYYKTYSYIIAKYISKYPEYIQSVLHYNFNQLLSLDIEGSIKKESLSVVAINSNLEEEILVDRKIFFNDSITFEVPSEINKLRIHMSNIPSFYRRISLTTSNCQTEVLPVKANAHIDNHSYVFSDFYPFIEFDLTPYLDKQFILEYERFNISDITSETYIANELIKVIESKNQSLAESDSLLLESQKTNDDSLRLMELQSEYDELFQKYHAVIGSRRWIFPTKIINFFRRKK